MLGFLEIYKEAIGKVIDDSNPKEARKMVSNLSETLKKAYDDAVIMGAEQKKEIVVNMLSKKMDEKLISDITGLLVDKVKAIKQDNQNKIH